MDRVLRLAATSAQFLGVAAAGGPDTRDPAELRRLALELGRQLGLQLDLPQGGQKFWHFTFPVPTGIILVSAATLTALYLAYLFVLHGRGDLWARWSGRDAMLDGQGVGTGTAGGADEGSPIAADELARQGRFVEAMHSLLLYSLVEIRGRLGERFADSLTSREILRSARLPETGRAPLRDIIARVEWSYFGGHPAEESDYRACRARFDELARALRGEFAG